MFVALSVRFFMCKSMLFNFILNCTTIHFKSQKIKMTSNETFKLSTFPIFFLNGNFLMNEFVLFSVWKS